MPDRTYYYDEATRIFGHSDIRLDRDDYGFAWVDERSGDRIPAVGYCDTCEYETTCPQELYF